ncbi:MAG: DUF1566 domain-containing protein [Candidatus Omnitrophota bacterium]
MIEKGMAGNRGAVLLMVIIFVMVTIIAGAALYFSVYNSYKSCGIGEVNRVEDYYIAYAGLSYASMLLADPRGNFGFSTLQTGDNEGPKTIEISSSQNNTMWRNLGLTGNRKISIAVTEDSSTRKYKVASTSGGVTVYDLMGLYIAIPRTGQTTCYVAGDDGTYNTGGPASGTEYSYDAATGILTDNVTGLMWATKNQGINVTWTDAIKKCGECTAGGFRGWRLPNIKELLTLVNYGHQVRIEAGGQQGFAYGETTAEDGVVAYDFSPWPLNTDEETQYWSSTTAFINTSLSWSDNRAFCVNFGTGLVVHNSMKDSTKPKDLQFYIPVRDNT